jgi:hypothetical protein
MRITTRMSDTAEGNWLGRRVRDKYTGAIGKVTADLPDPDHDVLAVYFGPGQWNSYHPNTWSKEQLFELIDE